MKGSKSQAELVNCSMEALNTKQLELTQAMEN